MVLKWEGFWGLDDKVTRGEGVKGGKKEKRLVKDPQRWTTGWGWTVGAGVEAGDEDKGGKMGIAIIE